MNANEGSLSRGGHVQPYAARKQPARPSYNGINNDRSRYLRPFSSCHSTHDRHSLLLRRVTRVSRVTLRLLLSYSSYSSLWCYSGESAETDNTATVTGEISLIHFDPATLIVLTRVLSQHRGRQRDHVTLAHSATSNIFHALS